MSEWIVVKKEDIDQNELKNEVHILYESDDNGNRYISIEGEALKHLKQLITNHSEA